MDNNDEINILSDQLEQLYLEHSTIGEKIRAVSQELRNLSRADRNSKRPNRVKSELRTERKVSLEECHSLVGRKVRIINPKKLEECFGRITKVGTLYITIQLPNGSTKRRIASNIRLIQDD